MPRSAASPSTELDDFVEKWDVASVKDDLREAYRAVKDGNGNIPISVKYVFALPLDKLKGDVQLDYGGGKLEFAAMSNSPWRHFDRHARDCFGEEVRLKANLEVSRKWSEPQAETQNAAEPGTWCPWTATVLIKRGHSDMDLLKYLKSTTLNFICPLSPGVSVGKIGRNAVQTKVDFNGVTYSECCNELGIFRECFLYLKFEIPWKFWLKSHILSMCPELSSKAVVSRAEQKKRDSCLETFEVSGPGKVVFTAETEDGDEKRYLVDCMVDGEWDYGLLHFFGEFGNIPDGFGNEPESDEEADAEESTAVPVLCSGSDVDTVEAFLLANYGDFLPKFRSAFGEFSLIELVSRYPNDTVGCKTSKIASFCAAKCLLTMSQSNLFFNRVEKNILHSDLVKEMLAVMFAEFDKTAELDDPRKKFMAEFRPLFADKEQAMQKKLDGWKDGEKNSMKWIQVFVKTLTGLKYTIGTYTHDTVKTLKFQLQDQTGYPVDQQRFIFGGKQLEDDLTLFECGITREATVDLVLRLSGC